MEKGEDGLVRFTLSYSKPETPRQYTKHTAPERASTQGDYMKYVKMLGLAAVAAMALMAFAGAGSASAAGVLCSTTVSPCPSTQKVPVNTILDWSLVPGGSALLETTSSGRLNTCTISTVKGKLTKNEAGAEATGPNEEIKWEGCEKASTTIVLGGLKINNIAGTSNGTVIADSEIRVTIAGLFSGENCVYGVAAGTSIGTFTEGKPAIFDANATATKTEPPGDPCFFGPGTTKWTAEYQLTSPANTTLSVSTS